MKGSGSITKLVDVAFLTRPPLLCVSCTFFFAGAVSALRTTQQVYNPRLLCSLLPNLLMFGLVVSAAFVVNQIFDVESDRLSRKLFLLPSGAVSRKESAAFLAVLGAVAILLSLGRSPVIRLLVWLGLGLGFAYSVPPVRLKGRPLADLLANVIGFGLIGFALGWLVFKAPSREMLVRTLPYMVAMAGVFLNTCIPDEEVDRLIGDRTSCVIFGRQAVSRMALLLMVGAALAGVLAGEPLCWLAVVGSLPASLAVAVEPTIGNSVLASQSAARLLFFLVCLRAPVLALLGAAAYAASRIYYRRRFGIAYPRITGAQQIPVGSR